MASSIQEEVRNPLTTNYAVKGGNVPQTFISYEEIAIKLLHEKFLLTALELHAELCEAGRELPILRDFFSNPNNFETQNIKPEPYTPMPRSSSQATLDSLDMTRYSEDGGGVDERVAVLEFELRKAKENISALRANLTVVTESESTALDKGFEKHGSTNLPIKPHEQKALNFLINEYLLAHSYKLTSITFNDENENQDFEDWDDVGLNILKPAELLQIYREFMRANGHEKPPSVNVVIQTDLADTQFQEKKKEFDEVLEEVERLKHQTMLLEQEKADLQQLLASTNLTRIPAEGSTGTIQTVNSNSTTSDKFELLESPPLDTPNITQEFEEDDSASAVVSLGETDPGDREWTRIQLPRLDVTDETPTTPNSPFRRLPTRFRKEVMAYCTINTSSSTMPVEELLRIGISRDTLVEILAHSLPRIVPNVILNKREEMIPLILSAVRLHSDAREKEKLLQLLFNLKKRPQEDERQMILAGLVVMAKFEEGLMESEEILSQCWEQSQHKHPERRLLAAECCCALAPYILNRIRNSLMLSMLQQMLLDDKDSAVRAAVVRSLALLVALMDDPDKYFQCEELTLTALDDAASVVVDMASSVLVPVMAQWALSLKRLQSHLLPRIISKLRNQLKSTSHHQHSPSKDYSDKERIVTSISVLQCLLPHTIVCVANNDTVRTLIDEDTSCELPLDFTNLCRSNIINPNIFYEGEIDIAVLLNNFFSNTWENDSWPELEWLTSKLIPDVVEMVKSVEVSQDNIFNALLTYIRSLCLGFGRYITQTKVYSVFAPEMAELENQLMAFSQNKENMCLTLIPAYLIVLSTLDPTQVAKSLKHFITVLSISGANIANLQIAVVRLCDQAHIQEFVLSALWDGVVHQRPNVRCTTATLFTSVVPHVSDRLANIRIVPAIVTLAGDSDITVRCAAIPALGRLVMECGVREARDKARLTLETIAREPQDVPSSLAVPLVSTFASIAPNCPLNYIEDVIATQLTGITASALQQSRKIDLASALVEAYSVLVYCPLSAQCITGVLLPGLRHLETLVNQVLPQQKELIRSLLKEAESRQDIPKPIERSSSTSSGLSLSMATTNVGQGVEDMRQRMSKIFQQKANSPNMPSIFRKK